MYGALNEEEEDDTKVAAVSLLHSTNMPRFILLDYPDPQRPHSFPANVTLHSKGAAYSSQIA